MRLPVSAVLIALALAVGGCGATGSRAAGSDASAIDSASPQPPSDARPAADRAPGADAPAPAARSDSGAIDSAAPRPPSDGRPAADRVDSASPLPPSDGRPAADRAPGADAPAVIAPTAFRFVQIADPQMAMTDALGTDKRYFRLAVSKINALDPPAAFVINTGDMVQDNASATQWDDYFEVSSKIVAPHYEVMGNHDGWSTSGLVRWRTTWNKKDRYSFVHGGCVFVGLNSYFLKQPTASRDEATKQKTFLEDTLKANAAAPCKFLFFHTPMYLQTPQEVESRWNLPSSERAYLLSIIDTHGVTAVLTGHYHRIAILSHDNKPLITSGPTSQPQGNNSDGTASQRGFMVYDFDVAKRKLDHRYVVLKASELPP